MTVALPPSTWPETSPITERPYAYEPVAVLTTYGTGADGLSTEDAARRLAEVGPNGRVTRLIEKPTDMNNNLVVVGCYYFKQGERLMAAIERQIRDDVRTQGEYFLADAVNLMAEAGVGVSGGDDVHEAARQASRQLKDLGV